MHPHDLLETACTPIDKDTIRPRKATPGHFGRLWERMLTTIAETPDSNSFAPYDAQLDTKPAQDSFEMNCEQRNWLYGNAATVRRELHDNEKMIHRWLKMIDFILPLH